MSNIQIGQQGLPIQVVDDASYDSWLAKQSQSIRDWLKNSGFKAPGYSLVPGNNGCLDHVLVVTKKTDSMWVLSQVAAELPVGEYFFNGNADEQYNAALGWLLAQYRFTRYKKAESEDQPVLYIADPVACQRALATAESLCLTRDMINTPASDMMPEDISGQLLTLAQEFGADFNEIVGDDLLTKNYPTIHMVGRASSHSPRLLELNWGKATDPKLVLVGKGVCFDSGGLDLKPAAGMRLMKKDMGGAAHAMGLAKMIMSFQLPVQLRVLIPAVENAVSGSAYRPGDIVTTRKGLTVEIDNTDAEGRLVLCDALAEAETQNPDLIIDFATLTGAARVALGLEVPAFFSTDDNFSQQMMSNCYEHEDAIWQLPLHQDYAEFMNGSISDLVNASSTPFGGAITAALFLQNFVENTAWVHFDVGAWNDRARPGRPKGGEAFGIRAVYNALQARYCS